ncbi:MAG: Stk1 family PASTA domain-containing Ser/Thr kinase [Armatimonadetes bacterium]|nr:Stk1 family PASTA domain-containing Ser/Thr kinase [Armatimonadota bacterium]
MSQAMILSGRYQVGQRLGEGGMAIVFSGTDLKLQRPVAIKMLRPHLAGDAELVARFNQEAQAAAGLNHPNIAAVYDTGQDAGRRYIIMELLPNITLKQRIVESRTGRLAPDEAMGIAIEVGHALAAAHAHGVVHRDIKPANILFTADGHVKVTDFGIARALAQTTGTATGTILGSPHYLSPEQARGQASGPRSDVYSLGVMLYEMLTGRTPYEGETPVAIALQHVQGTPPPIRSVVLGVPAPLEAVVARAMAREPEARFGTANELVAALEAVRAGLPAPVGVAATQAFAPPPMDATMVMPAVSAPAGYPDQPTPYIPVQERGGGDNRLLIIGLAIFLAVVGGLTVGVMLVPHGDMSTGGTVTGSATPTRKQIVVEDLTGKDAEMERARLEEQCRSQKIQPPQVLEMGQEDSPLELGRITRQEPAAGTSIDEGGIIRVWISTGFERVDVPDVLGLSVADAQQMITGKGLTVGQVKDDYSSDYNEGFVASQNPAPRTKVRANTPVTLVVSKGPKPPDPNKDKPKVLPPDITVTPMEQLDTGQKKTHVKVTLPDGSADARVELRWLEGAHGSPGGGTVSPSNDFEAEVRGDAGSKLGVFVNDKEQKVINF